MGPTDLGGGNDSPIGSRLGKAFPSPLPSVCPVFVCESPPSQPGIVWIGRSRPLRGGLPSCIPAALLFWTDSRRSHFLARLGARTSRPIGNPIEAPQGEHWGTCGATIGSQSSAIAFEL